MFKISILIALLGIFGMMLAMFLSLNNKEEFSDKVFKISFVIEMIGLFLLASVVLLTN